MSEQVEPLQDRTNRTKTGQEVTESSKVVRRLPKDHTDHWRGKLRKRKYTDRSGRLNEIPTWQVRVFHTGKETWFNTGTANKDAASVRARDFYVFLRANGWDAALAHFKPKPEDKAVVTVGEFLAQVKAVGGLKPGTYEIYARKFRSLVAYIFRIDPGPSKHDHVNGGHADWLSRIHNIRLESLTPAKVNQWKVDYLKAASGDPLKLKRAGITARSILISSKSLFSTNIRRHLTVSLAHPLPFEDVELPSIGRSRYKSEIDPQVLLVAAKRELADATGTDATTRLEMFKIILLALGAGLRRDEIDSLTWKQLDFTRNVIRIETNIYTAAKSAESENEVDVDPGLMAIFKDYMAGSQGVFVIQSPVAPRPAAVSYHHYRCQRLFRLVINWLRSKGVSSRNALHTLRKEFGSQIAAQAGIFAASLALRHSNISLTRDYYLDKKQPTFLSVTKLMSEQRDGEPNAIKPSFS